ncbi:MAG: hypothetical protein R3A49_13410 [Acidimicrobiia bacterium]
MLRSRPRLLCAFGALALLLGACRVDAVVSVEMSDDGSGTVRVAVALDADAVAAAESGGGTLEDRFRLADLTDAGWSVGGWERSDDGSARIEIAHAFGTPGEAGELVESLNGDVGPVPELTLERSESLLETTFTADGVVDLAGVTAGVTADEELTAALEAAGADAAAVDLSLSAAAQQNLAVALEVEFPDGSTEVVAAEPGERVELSGSASVPDSERITLLIVAAGLVGLAVVVVVVGRGLDRHRRSRR